MKKSKKLLVSFIVVFLNEEENLIPTYEEISRISDLLPQVDYEIIFVNDGSSDSSWEIVRGICKRDSRVKAISFTRNFGAISAVMAGLSEAKGDFLVDMASDGQESLQLFISLIKNNIEKKLDISWAVRKSRKDSFMNRFFAKLYYSIMRRFAIPNFPKEGLDAFCISRKLAEFLLNNYDGTSNMHNLLYWVNSESGKVYYDRKERRFGKSKWSLSKKINLFVNSFVSFSIAPLRLISIMGVIMIIIGFFWTLYILVYVLFIGHTVQGFASLMALLLIGFGFTNFSLGVIAEYIWRILERTKPKPLFMVKEKLNLP